MTLASASAFAQQTCYVDMIDSYGRVVGTFTGWDSPNVCIEGMKQCRKSVRLEPHLGGVDCIRHADRPVSQPLPQPLPRPLPPQQSGHCEMDRPCGQVYSRLEALRALQAAENKNEDAEGNLMIVMNAVNSHQIPLYAATEGFNRVLMATGGSNTTSEARAAFQDILSYMRRTNIGLFRLITGLNNAIRMENKVEDGRANFSIIMNAVERGIFLEEGVSVFYDVLFTMGGSNFTSEAQRAFNKIVANIHLASLPELSESLRTILRAENKNEDGIANFDLVLRAAAVCGSIHVATQDFLDTLRTMGGSNYTGEAQRMYRRLYNI